MSIKRILVLSLAATALSTVAWADDTYQCGESRCYDDQADETRRLNLMQLENPGAGLDAVPGQDADTSYADPDDSPSPYADENDDGGMNGQGGPYDPYDPDGDGDDNGPPPDAYSTPPDDSYAPDDVAPPDTGAYPDDDNDGGYPGDDDDGPYRDDDE